MNTRTFIGGPLDGQTTSADAINSQSGTSHHDAEGNRLFHTYVREGEALKYKGLFPFNEGLPEEIREPVAPEDSLALRHQSEHYPEKWNRRVPRLVKLLKHVQPDFGALLMSCKELAAHKATAGTVVDVTVNSHGAVTAILPGNRQLGLRPSEFEVVGWHEMEVAK